MVERIKKIAEHWELSPTAFADKIEVARPVISHVFSERNRPSLEVVQKIGLAFPEVNTDWLLYGNGGMLRIVAEKLDDAGLIAKSETPLNPAAEGQPAEEKPKPVPEKKVPNISSDLNRSAKREIKTVMVFYTDQSVEIFDPAANN